MKIGIIPDIHGNSTWQENVKKMVDCDKIVFLGDYVDSFNENERGLKAAENLKKIFQFARENKDKVDLLIGNHDLENYWLRCNKCSGFQPLVYETYHSIFEENKDLIKLAVKYDDWVFSHAGFTKTWVECTISRFKFRFGEDTDFELLSNDPVEMSNKMLQEKISFPFEYSESDFSCYGESVKQGPLWVRPTSLMKEPFYEKQVVGHTESRSGSPIFLKNNKMELVLADTSSHATYIIFDTKNPPEFLTPEEAAKKQRKEEKDIQRQKSVYGQKAKELRDKYNISKKDFQWFEFQAGIAKRACEEHNDNSFDWWTHLEDLCKSKAEETSKNE